MFIQRTHTCIYSQKNYSFKEIIFVQFKELSLFKENIFNEGNHIHSSSRKYVHSRKLYSFNNVAFADIAELFIQQVCPAGTL